MPYGFIDYQTTQSSGAVGWDFALYKGMQQIYLYKSFTKVGVKAARELGDTLPASIKEKMFDEAVKVYTRDAMKKKGSLLAVRYVNNANGSCTVGITVKDEETGRQKYYLSVSAENSERAEQIKDKITSDPKAFSKYLDDYFG